MRAYRTINSILSSLVCCASSLCLVATIGAASAHASSDQSSDPSAKLNPTPGLDFNINLGNAGDVTTPVVGLSSSLQDAGVEIPNLALGSRIFDLDASNLSCVTGQVGCFTRENQLSFNASKNTFGASAKNLDFVLTPRASLRFDDESSSAVVGALVKIGEDLREDDNLVANTWYMFAGADAEAVTYAPGSVRRLTQGQFHLQDRIIIGDTQAGVGYRIGDADLSLGYFRREISSFGREVDMNGVSMTEDAAALSFTWRR